MKTKNSDLKKYVQIIRFVNRIEFRFTVECFVINYIKHLQTSLKHKFQLKTFKTLCNVK